MERSVYQALLEKLTLPINAVPHFRALAALFGVSLETVYSIYSQEVQARVVRTHHVLKQSVPDLMRRYLAGSADALQLCYEADLPPCVVLRRLLEALGMGKTRITDALRAPAALPALLGEGEVRALLAGAPTAARAVGGSGTRPAAEGAEDAAAIAAFYRRLQADIALCVLCDRVYSPESDAARHAAGVAHEARLYADLRAAGVAFWSEEELRSKGFLKTPDAKLQVPIAVRGRVVNWIDSKATFGDTRLHRQQGTEQYQRYVNRFGPGLVIYWHGFLADLVALEGKRGEKSRAGYGGGEEEEEEVLVMDRFPLPEEITALPCLPLTLAGGGGSLALAGGGPPEPVPA